MAIFKCKMCGGALEITEGLTVSVCEFCGTKQTLPNLDNEKRANLYDRANHFRRNNEYDKAMSIYEQILNEDSNDSEAYWSIVLCRYGIEYVEDPGTHKRVPTVNRMQFTSIFADTDYKTALSHADGYQKDVYEEEARLIDTIQKGILSISQNETPFDVFICYKETDETGRRTPDSVLANELYHELTKEGFKVFFARITLEDKLGTAYEPYIFAALNSSKVMVVIGTKASYINAVWVKNEWSRFLSQIKNGEKKYLIPAYKDMDPYDLPEEFSHLQAQDMTKLGFMPDLVRGIKKLLGTNDAVNAQNNVQNVQYAANTVNVSSLLKRTFVFLEDGDFENAATYTEKVLDMDAECAEAYLIKTMIERRYRKREELGSSLDPLMRHDNFAKAVRFAGSELKAELEGYNKAIQDNIAAKKLSELNMLYEKAISQLNSADTVAKCLEARTLFEDISDFKDSVEYMQKCYEKAYKTLCKALDNAKMIQSCYCVNDEFEQYSVSSWKVDCEDFKRKYNEKLYILLVDSFQNNNSQSEIMKIRNGFKMLGDYNDSAEYANRCKDKAKELRLKNTYEIAVKSFNAQDYANAMDLFLAIPDYKDSNEKFAICLGKNKKSFNIQKKSNSDIKNIFQLIKKIIIYFFISSLIALAITAASIVLGFLINLIFYKIDNYFSLFLKIGIIIGIIEIIIFIIFKLSDDLGYGSFKYSNKKRKVSMPEYNNYKFTSCIIIPYKKSNTFINKNGFSRSKMTNILIPKNIICIEVYAFSSCKNLKSIILPEGLSIIKQFAFEGCSSLAFVVLPNSITKIENNAFLNCNNLKTVVYNGTKNEWHKISADSGINYNSIIYTNDDVFYYNNVE